MKNYIIISAAIMLVVAVGCKKHHTLPRVPSPNWAVEDIGQYPVSMTAVVQVPASLQSHLRDGDKMAAFVGDECRGIGTWVHSGGVSAFFILIHGTPAEQARISFKYYYSWKSNMYETEPFLDFVVDGGYGSVDAPQILDLRPEK